MAGVKGVEQLSSLDGRGKTVAIIRTRWNTAIIDALVAGAREELNRCGVVDAGIIEVQVPGSYELPFAARTVIESTKVDAVLCIGCLIKGETMHFEYICEAVTQGIMRVQLDTSVPVIFGVLCVLTEDQALARAGLKPGMHNHGPEWAQSALEMANLRWGTGTDTIVLRLPKGWRSNH